MPSASLSQLIQTLVRTIELDTMAMQQRYSVRQSQNGRKRQARPQQAGGMDVARRQTVSAETSAAGKLSQFAKAERD